MARTTLPSPLLALAAVLSVGCGEDFAPESELHDLRILAIRSEPPELRPNEVATLDALVWMPPGEAADEGSDEQAHEQTPTYEWRVCYLPTADYAEVVLTADFAGGGLPASCFEVPNSVSLAELLESDDLDLTTTAIDLGSDPTATMVGFDLPAFSAPPSFCSELSEHERLEQGGREMWLGGLRLMVSLRVRWSGQERVANKRIVLRPDPATIPPADQGRPFRTPRLCSEAGEAERVCAPNANPAPPLLHAPNGEWEGQGPIQARPGQQIKLRAVTPEPDDLQPFVSMKLCGEQVSDPVLAASGGEYERVESRWWYWYVSGGEVALEGAHLSAEIDETESAWKAPKDAAPGERYELYFLAVDGRGGVSWTRYELEIVP